MDLNWTWVCGKNEINTIAIYVKVRWLRFEMSNLYNQENLITAYKV